MREIGLYPVKCPGLTLQERMHRIKLAGFDYVCANIGSLEEDAPEDFLECARRENLPVDHVHLIGSRTSTIWYEGEEGDAVADRYCREMAHAVERGVTKGVAHVTWGLEMPPLTEIGLKRLDRIVESAAKTGFTICFENSVSAAHFCTVQDRYDLPCVRFCFDSGHWNAFAADTDIPDRYSARMAITHLQDNDGWRDLHMIPLDGCAPYEKIAGALRGMRRLSFEVAGVVRRECPGQSAAEIREGLKRVAVLSDPRLLKVYDGGFTVYEDLSYDAYLHRLMAAAVRIRDLVEAQA